MAGRSPDIGSGSLFGLSLSDFNDLVWILRPILRAAPLNKLILVEVEPKQLLLGAGARAAGSPNQVLAIDVRLRDILYGMRQLICCDLIALTAYIRLRENLAKCLKGHASLELRQPIRVSLLDGADLVWAIDDFDPLWRCGTA